MVPEGKKQLQICLSKESRATLACSCRKSVNSGSISHEVVPQASSDSHRFVMALL